jgi:TolA-binding protein
MMKFAGLAVLTAITLTGCLTTRAQLRSEQTTRTQQVSQVQEKQAQAVARIEEYDDQLRAINGRIDLLENQMSQFNAGHADRQSMDVKQRDEFNNKLKVYEEALRKLETQLAAANEEIALLKARKQVAAAPAPSAKDAFTNAEDAFNKKDFKQAIVDYEAYRKASPKGKNYPAATFKIGMAFAELNMKDEAKAFFEEVVSKFPSSKEAKKASQRLKAMK